MNYVIIKDSPIPPSNKTRWPFSHMEIGDSIIIDADDEWLKACSSSASAARKHNMRFQTSWPRNREYGQIWRVG